MELAGSSEVRREEPRHFGISPDLLSDDIFRAVVAIYYEVAKHEAVDVATLMSAYHVSELKDCRYETHYRIGSILGHHSKLYVEANGYLDEIVCFSFDPNHSRREDEQPGTENHRIGKVIEEQFATRIDELFLAIGVAQPVFN